MADGRESQIGLIRYRRRVDLDLLHFLRHAVLQLSVIIILLLWRFIAYYRRRRRKLHDEKMLSANCPTRAGANGCNCSCIVVNLFNDSAGSHLEPSCIRHSKPVGDSSNSPLNLAISSSSLTPSWKVASEPVVSFRGSTLPEACRLGQTNELEPEYAPEDRATYHCFPELVSPVTMAMATTAYRSITPGSSPESSDYRASNSYRLTQEAAGQPVEDTFRSPLETEQSLVSLFLDVIRRRWAKPWNRSASASASATSMQEDLTTTGPPAKPSGVEEIGQGE
ncbi:unnamed protein product [Protopolystoma xenopodis]|uniref:Uncharacterized protein n=1 Tax=Protopolystoma xenopodis TaxID=117903 RepID=A0A448WAB4_9PLAT|nr:unnamed protein product [Protopolystoma xenopodis]